MWKQSDSSSVVISVGTSDGFCGAFTSKSEGAAEVLHQYDAGLSLRGCLLLKVHHLCCEECLSSIQPNGKFQRVACCEGCKSTVLSNQCDNICLSLAGTDFKIIGAGSVQEKLLYFAMDNDGNVVPRCWDAHSGVEVDLNGDSQLRSALKGDCSRRHSMPKTPT